MTTTPPHPADHSRALRAVEDAAELLTRIAVALPLRWPHLVDALPGQPGAQTYDGDAGGPGTVVVCTLHQRDISDCHRARTIGCTGVPVPKRTDPTGAAGCAPTRASIDAKEFRRLAASVARAAEDMVRILERYGPRAANAYERAATAQRNDDPGCASCCRLEVAQGIARWEPVDCSVRIGDELVPVCRWCRSWVKDTGSLPDRRTLQDHHDGKRVRRPA